MRKDHRPYFVKKLHLRLQHLYAQHFIRPQLDFLGSGFTFMKPWHVKIFGPRIRIGECATIIAESDKKVRIAVWSETNTKGSITIGKYGMICPGVRIGSADNISIGDNCMFANNAYITDADWHGLYNRITLGRTGPVTIEDNVWIGDTAIVCKGVTIGKNSIIGAGAVVVSSIPPNGVAAGNPAKTIKFLKPETTMIKRAALFSNPRKLFKDFDSFDKELLKNNGVLNWIRQLLFPSQND